MHQWGVEPRLTVVIFFTNADRTISRQCVYYTPPVPLRSLVIFANYESVVCSNLGKKIIFFKKLTMTEMMHRWGFEPCSFV
jgi:hypothetical protein